MSQTTGSVFDKIPMQFYNLSVVDDTLQGSIYRASICENDDKESGIKKKVVVKVTDKQLHDSSTSIVGNSMYQTEENIVSEQMILKYVTQQNDCPQTIAKFIAFFRTDDFFVLVQEDGGYPLFDFVKNAHMLIKTNKIDLSHWKKVVKVILKQMIECVSYLHSKNVCHHDISLENFLINDVRVAVDKAQKMSFILEGIQIKLCDFGLSEMYPRASCLSNKYCGKTLYKSPEIMNFKTNFDAKKSDIWSVGVCVFVLLYGFPPWRAAQEHDIMFDMIMNGRITELLTSWNVSSYSDPFLMDLLFQAIFKSEEKRISTDEIKATTNGN